MDDTLRAAVFNTIGAIYNRYICSLLLQDFKNNYSMANIVVASSRNQAADAIIELCELHDFPSDGAKVTVYDVDYAYTVEINGSAKWDNLIANVFIDSRNADEKTGRTEVSGMGMVCFPGCFDERQLSFLQERGLIK